MEAFQAVPGQGPKQRAGHAAPGHGAGASRSLSGPPDPPRRRRAFQLDNGPVPRRESILMDPGLSSFIQLNVFSTGRRLHTFRQVLPLAQKVSLPVLEALLASAIQADKAT